MKSVAAARVRVEEAAEMVPVVFRAEADTLAWLGA